MHVRLAEEPLAVGALAPGRPPAIGQAAGRLSVSQVDQAEVGLVGHEVGYLPLAEVPVADLLPFLRHVAVSGAEEPAAVLADPYASLLAATE